MNLMTWRVERKITIVSMRRPEDSLNKELQWLGSTLGLISERDKDSSCFRVFIELLKTAKLKQSVTSDELAYKLDLSRGTIVHHLNRLISAGLIVPDRRGYSLRVKSLSELMSLIENDFQNSMKEIKKVANDLDGKLGLKESFEEEKTII